MSHFEVDYQILELQLDQPFTISRGTKNAVRNVLLRLTADGITGCGEAGPNRRYDEDAEKVIRHLDSLPGTFFDDIQSVEELTDRLDQLPAGPSKIHSANAMIEMAWLDWWAKNQGQALWELWDAPSNKTPSTSYTIGLDDIEVMQRKVEAAADYPILKVKLGTERDHEIIKAIRAMTDKPIRVDANEGWTDLETAQKRIAFLANKDIELIEQPMPAAMHAELRSLKEWSPLPLVADESFLGDEDLEQLVREFDGINIKLDKIGSLVKARQVIQKARQLNLKVMVGCMVESSLAIAAGALMGTWADYVDLDGFLLIREDPFEGLELTPNKEIVLNNASGLGITMKST